MEAPTAEVPQGHRFFAWYGPSIFYALSALCVLMALSRLVGPALATATDPLQSISGAVALQLYELALLAVLCGVILRRDVEEDAVGLIVISALFLGAGGIVTSAVANDDPVLAVWLGLGGFGLGVIKIIAWRRYARMDLPPVAMMALVLLLAWHFLAGPALAWAVRLRVPFDEDFVAQLWRGLSLLPWIAFGLCAIWAHRWKPASAGQVFLRRPEMAWIIMLVTSVGVALHQYALGYVFSIQMNPWDAMPLIWCVCAVALGMSRHWTWAHRARSVWIWAPAWVTLAAAMSLPSAEAVWVRPDLAMACGAILWMGLGRMHGRAMIYAAVFQLIGAVALWEVTPGSPLAQWHGFEALLLGTGACWMLAADRRDPTWAVCASMTLTGSVVLWQIEHGAIFGMWPMGVMAMTAGASMLLAEMVFVRRLAKQVVRTAAGLMAMGMAAAVTPQSVDLFLHWGVLAVGPIIGVMLWWRSSQRVAAVLASAAFSFQMVGWLWREEGWGLFVLGTLLLGVGAISSWIKGRQPISAEARHTPR